MTIDDLILESAESITKAMQSLIKAATRAQKELVSQGKLAEGMEGSQDNQQGLITAAKLVAAATTSLCEAANSMIQAGFLSLFHVFVSQDGSEDGSDLVSSAKQVSKATVQLVLACQVHGCKKNVFNLSHSGEGRCGVPHHGGPEGCEHGREEGHRRAGQGGTGHP